MLTLNSIMIGTTQLDALLAFYEKVVGRPPDEADKEQGFYGWRVGGTFLGVLAHSEMGGKAKDPGRLMFNFETTQVKEEFERIKGIGATVVSEPYTDGPMSIATLADPDGNYFQVMTPVGRG